jgi:hypothetical protein
MTERLRKMVDGVIIEMTESEEVKFLASLPITDSPSDSPVPTSVARVQALLALNQAGLLTMVKDTIASYNDDAIAIWFNHADTWRRENPYVLGLSLEMGLSEEQVDDLFRSAILFV